LFDIERVGGLSECEPCAVGADRLPGGADCGSADAGSVGAAGVRAVAVAVADGGSVTGSGPAVAGVAVQLRESVDVVLDLPGDVPAAVEDGDRAWGVGDGDRGSDGVGVRPG
jgi:hypothetical protein